MAKNSVIGMLEDVVKNQVMLYVIFVFSLANVFGYLATSNYEAFIFFTLVLFVSKEFTNHIGLALLSAMVSTNLLLSIVKGRRVYETFVSVVEGDGHEKNGTKKQNSMEEKQVKNKDKDKDKHRDKQVDKDVQGFTNDVNNFNKLESMLSHQEGLMDSLDRIDNMIDKLKGLNSTVAAQEQERQDKKANSN